MCSMKSFAKLTVPAIVFAAVSVLQVGTARAAITLDQFTVVVGGWQLEQRCNHLGAVKHDNLGRVAAAAEVDAARRFGVSKVGEVLKGAEEFGKQMGENCGDETEQAVTKSYEVATRYATSRNAVVNPQRERKRAETPRLKRRKTDTTEPDLQVPGRRALIRYGIHTEAYYLQRRCRHLPYSQDVAFWQLIRKQHHQLIRKFGAGAVGRVSRRAKANANSPDVRCGSRTYRTVHTGLRAIRRDFVSN